MAKGVVIVVGAGIVGAACADACARAGYEVTVCEAAGIGGGATAAGMGHLVVMDDSEAQFALTDRSQRLWRTLAPKLPAAAEFASSGTIWVAADAEEMTAVEQKHAYYGERGIETTILDAAALAREEPNLRGGLAGGLLVASDCVVYPPVAAEFLLERSGATIKMGEPVVALGQGEVRFRSGAALQADVIVNAAGMAAGRLTPGLPIRARKGHLLITDRYPGWVRHQLVELGYLKSAHSQDGDSVAFNAQPRPTGQVLIGSSRQFGVTDAAVDRAMLARMLRRAEQYMPALAGLSAIRTWTGVRAATPDGLPLIGPAREDATVLVASGHEGLGITTALVTGELIAAILTGGASAIPPEPYLPTRFQETEAYGHHG
ncbi:MAG: FAD-binding oxidoreductase [Acidobacteria bacterium]|nr:MAG: FAD-binding oxidoreductase [Acidobacteriota bacterium]